MSIKIRLARGGSKKRPYYRVVVANTTSPRDGRFIEKIGTFNPILADDHADKLKLDVERAKYWLSVGAQPSDRVARFLDKLGIRTRVAPVSVAKALPKKKAQERAAAAAEKAKAAAEAPAAE